MKTTNTFMILYAIILQTITAVVILFSKEPVLIASLGVFYQVFPLPEVGAVLQLLASGLALIGLFREFKSKAFHLSMFVPQQFFLLLTAGSAVNYIYLGHYADGITRPIIFIFLDQLPAIIAAVLYSLSVIRLTKKDSYGWS